MTDQAGFNKMEALLRDNPQATFAFYPADPCIPRDRFLVSIPFDGPAQHRIGYGAGRVIGEASTLDGAYYIARARLDDVQTAEAA